MARRAVQSSSVSKCDCGALRLRAFALRAGAGVLAAVASGHAAAWCSGVDVGWAAGRAIAAGVTLYRPDTTSLPESAGAACRAGARARPATGRLDDRAGARHGAGACDRGRRRSTRRRRRPQSTPGSSCSLPAIPRASLRVDGGLVSDARLLRGAVAMRRVTRRAAIDLRSRSRPGRARRARGSQHGAMVALDGVDTVRRRAAPRSTRRALVATRARRPSASSGR